MYICCRSLRVTNDIYSDIDNSSTSVRQVALLAAKVESGISTLRLATRWPFMSLRRYRWRHRHVTLPDCSPTGPLPSRLQWVEGEGDSKWPLCLDLLSAMKVRTWNYCLVFWFHSLQMLWWFLLYKTLNFVKLWITIKLRRPQVAREFKKSIPLWIDSALITCTRSHRSVQNFNQHS